MAGTLVVAAAGPAAAKGPMGVALAQDGGEPIEVAAVEGDHADQDLLHTLAEDLGVWQATDTGSGTVAEPPTDDLGPALTAVWTMYNAMPGRAPDPRVIQTVYPLADGGALVHTAAGQHFFAESETVGGWFRAPDRLVDTLVRAGVGPDMRLPAPGREPTPAAPDAHPQPAAEPWWARAAVPGAIAVAAVLCGGLVVVQRRRRRALTVAG